LEIFGKTILSSIYFAGRDLFTNQPFYVSQIKNNKAPFGAYIPQATVFQRITGVYKVSRFATGFL
jgi:hypothetical protein